MADTPNEQNEQGGSTSSGGGGSGSDHGKGKNGLDDDDDDAKRPATIVSADDENDTADHDDHDDDHDNGDDHHDHEGGCGQSHADAASQQQREQSNSTLSPTESAIIEMLKKQNLQQQQILPTAVVPVTTTTSGGKHAFWDTQPMPHAGRQSDHNAQGPIEPNKPTNQIRQEPYSMPPGFIWSDVNVLDASELQQLYQLLSANYVEDDDALFRFDYSAAFLRWALTPPGWRSDWLFGVRTASNEKLVAFISAIPASLHLYGQTIPVAEINYLCVHKKLRSKRLAPVLIKEITRRVQLTGVFQAVYTAGTVLPVPVASARYYHRSLNPTKLVRVGFSRLGHRMTMARLQKLYKLPSNYTVPGIRPMTTNDVRGVQALLNPYLQQFQLKLHFSEPEIAHWFLPRPGVIDTFVISAAAAAAAPTTETSNNNNNDSNNHDDDDYQRISDMISFYHLPSSILNHDDTLFAAYSFYNVATTVPLLDLMRQALIAARNAGADVYNALNLMHNGPILEPLKFGKGDGQLQYYVYNWSCPEMPPNRVGIVLL